MVGVIVALAGPLLGAIADNTGYRKRWLAAFSAMLILGASLLWLAEPGASELMPLIFVAVVLTFLGAEFGTVFTNAMLPGLARPGQVGRLSGIGWSTGYAGALVALAVFLLLIFPATSAGNTVAGWPSLFPSLSKNHGGDRVTGPFAAIWYLVFVLPLFLFTPDIRTRARVPIGKAMVQGVRELARTLRQARTHAVMFRFLIARMRYVEILLHGQDPWLVAVLRFSPQAMRPAPAMIIGRLRICPIVTHSANR